MIQLIISGKQFDLDESVKFSFKSDNPFLAGASIPGTIVYQINGTISDNNRIITEYAEQIDNKSRKLKIEDVLVKIGGIVWRSGVMVLRKSGTSGYEFSFYSDAGDVKSKIENKKLSELPMEENVPVDDQSTDYYPTAKHVFFPVHNPDFYGTKNPDYLGYMNYYHNGSFGTNAIDNLHTKVPFIYTMYVLNAVFDFIGYTPSGDILSDEDANRMTVFNVTSLDELDGSGLNTYKANFNYTDHLPDISIADFLIDTCIFLGVTPIFNSKKKTVKLVGIEGYFSTSNAKDFNRKASTDYSITPSEYDGIKFMMKPDTRDKSLEQNADWLEFEQGNAKEPFDTNASTLQVELMEDSINTKTWTIPRVQQAGNSPAFDLQNKQRSLRFIYFKGNAQDSEENNYPQAHYEGVNVNLRWEGFTGLVEKRYKAWLAFKAATEPVDFEADVELLDVLNFDFEDKIMAHYMRYIIESYSVTVSKEGISPMQINAMTY